MSTISPLVEINVFATYKRQQTMLERQKWTNFQPEMQYQVTTNYDNCPAGPSAKIGVLGGDDFKTDKNYVDKEAPPSEWKYKLNKLQHKKGKGFSAPWRMKKRKRTEAPPNEWNELNKAQHREGKDFYAPKRMKYKLNKLQHKERKCFCAPSLWKKRRK